MTFQLLLREEAAAVANKKINIINTLKNDNKL
jgi:hypothetical protein